MQGAELKGPPEAGGTAGPLLGDGSPGLSSGGLSSSKVTTIGGNSFPATNSQAQQTIPLRRGWGHPSGFSVFFINSLEFVEQFLSGGIREWWFLSPFLNLLRPF